MRNSIKLGLALACLCGGTASASIVTVNFDQLVQSNDNLFAGPYYEKGFTITSRHNEMTDPNAGTMWAWGNGGLSTLYNADNAPQNSTTLANYIENDSLTLKKAGGGTFNIQSIDLAAFYDNFYDQTPNPKEFAINFHLNGSLLGTYYDVTDGLPGLQTFNLNFGWNDVVDTVSIITDVDFLDDFFQSAPSARHLQMDNIVLGVANVPSTAPRGNVPEPASLALLGLGLAGMTFFRVNKNKFTDNNIA